jgi:hypothetical protein
MEWMPKPGAVKEIAQLFAAGHIFEKNRVRDGTEHLLDRSEPFLATDKISQLVHANKSQPGPQLAPASRASAFEP